MSRSRPAAVAAIAVMAAMLAGCASTHLEEQLRLADPGGSCENVTQDVTGRGLGPARAFAIRSVQAEAGELKGDFVRAGFRGIRQSAPAVACEPYALTGPHGGLYRCVARIRVCG
jgi:hypothetical protein